VSGRAGQGRGAAEESPQGRSRSLHGPDQDPAEMYRARGREVGTAAAEHGSLTGLRVFLVAPEPAAMRMKLLGAGLALLLAGLAFWYTRNMAPQSLPGVDRSDFLPDAIPRHLTALRGDNPAERNRAALALWQMGDQAQTAVPTLLQTANDPHPEVRTAVLKALGRTSARTQAAIPALVEALADPTTEARAAAAEALAELWSADKMNPEPGSRAAP